MAVVHNAYKKAAEAVDAVSGAQDLAYGNYGTSTPTPVTVGTKAESEKPTIDFGALNASKPVPSSPALNPAPASTSNSSQLNTSSTPIGAPTNMPSDKTSTPLVPNLMTKGSGVDGSYDTNRGRASTLLAGSMGTDDVPVTMRKKLFGS